MDKTEFEVWLLEEYGAAAQAGMATVAEEKDRYVAIGKQRFIEAILDKLQTDPTRIVASMIQKGLSVPGLPASLPR
tara:strand:- start:8160 stop:8387 length:228 start_codon:yes stop_codon:yes gene_type:complete